MLVEVALPVPVPRTFTYLNESGDIPAGTRVRVPFSGRTLIGWVLGPGAAPRELNRLRSIERVLDDVPCLTPDLLALCRFIADYYTTPLGLVLRAALPAALSDTGRSASPARIRRVLRITRELPSLQSRAEVFGRAVRQRECYEVVEAAAGSMTVQRLTDVLGYSVSVLQGLVAKGLAEIGAELSVRDPFAELAVQPPAGHDPTAAQRAALAQLVAAAQARDPQPFLLLGVTGSGKTLVYIELLRHVVREQGRGAIVLVPEIALTPQTVARFRAEFGDVVAVLHSALSDGERFDAWRALRTGSRRIAIGARSAIFAPVQDLGALIVDEEHEASYKQSEAPRYHARELAVVRAARAGAVCLLGSATPSLESWSNTLKAKYRLLELPDRVAGRPLPPVQVVDLRGGKVWEQPPGVPQAQVPVAVRDRILAPVLVQAMGDRLERGEQTILLLNRRGYSSFVQCRNCGQVWHCPDCNVSLTYHRSRHRLVCHYCCHDEPVPERCGACGAADLSLRGIGTEQVERAVADTFPAARIARMDVDTTSGKWAHHRILDRVASGEVDILLGTQMIAKGLDFPGVTLVGVVNADVAMNLPDFRASERTFQLLTQVAGRAGRGPAGGEVLVQTALPTHYAIRAAIRHDYREFAARELEERRGPAYPPHERLAHVVVSGTAEIPVQDAAQQVADNVLELLAQHRVRSVVLTGPAPCPIDRIRGRWRWHFLLRSAAAGPLGAVCRHLQVRHELPPGRAELRLIVDRDPVSLL